MAMLVLGCQTQVIGGGSGGSGGGVDTATSSGDPTTTSTGVMTSGGPYDGGSPLPNDGPAIAMLYSELPNVVYPSGSAVAASGGGDDINPNSLNLFVSNGPQACINPYAYGAGCAAVSYQVSILLPPNLQAVGTYSLNNLAYLSVTEPGGGDTCSGGGGSYWDGTIEITAISATQVTFTLAGTAKIFSFTPQGTADGTFTAPRCF